MSIEQILLLINIGAPLSLFSIILGLMIGAGLISTASDTDKTYLWVIAWTVIILFVIACIAGIVMWATGSYLLDVWKYTHPDLVPIG